MTADEVRDLIRDACQEAGTVKAWAEANDISPQYVGDVLTGRRDPAGKILTALGLSKLVDYAAAPAARTGGGE